MTEPTPTGLKRLKSLRKARKLTQDQLAVAAGVSRPAIANMEDHRTGCKISTAIRIADALGCTLDELVGRGKVTSDHSAELELRRRLDRVIKLASRAATMLQDISVLAQLDAALDESDE